MPASPIRVEGQFRFNPLSRGIDVGVAIQRVNKRLAP